MTISTQIKQKAKIAFNELTFGSIKTKQDIEELKPLLWGSLIPWIFVGIFLSFLPIIIVPAVAALIQLAKGEANKAAKTIGWSLVLPGIAFTLYFLSMIMYVFGG